MSIESMNESLAAFARAYPNVRILGVDVISPNLLSIRFAGGERLWMSPIRVGA
jgi:hypothetical protein